MVRIKITSNPYLQETVFHKWDEAQNQWQRIDSAYNPNSELLREEFLTGFFPFKVKQIVDVILEEYCTASDPVNIVFEGTDDEFQQLKSICDAEKNKGLVTVEKGDNYLENARDILSDVIDVFKELNPLVSESVTDKEKIKRELDKFSDASNDIIPICVIGNYSSGKSTFINALVGYELLPSSDEPTTAKIYKIMESKYEDRAHAKFEIRGETVRIQLTATSFKVATAPANDPLMKRILTGLKENASESIAVKLHALLDIINTYANHEDPDAVSDLIEIEAPFDEDGLWGRMWNTFVIFDTPGSNSASNRKHYEVLKKAMENLSNGLPIFISEYDSLDSTDNEKLYNDINNMEELDSRFTMIIVNKADTANLKEDEMTEEKRERLLSLAIPRNLYSGGIYFVSSVMGLGAKNDENFISDHNAEIFEDQRKKYVDPKSRFYKRLYRCNIQPEQIKQKYNESAEKQSNLIYANSGLFNVEQAIEDFAAVYSPYNKCQQSQLFLGKVMDITGEEIAQSRRLTEEYRDRIRQNLDREKQELVNQLNAHSGEIQKDKKAGYPDYMKEFVESTKTTVTPEDLKNRENRFREIKAEALDVSRLEDDLERTRQSRNETLRSNLASIFKDPDLSKIKDLWEDYTEDRKDIRESRNELSETRRSVKKETSDDLIASVKTTFTYYFDQAKRQIETRSREYWAEATEQLRRELTEIVTQSPALTNQERGELAGIIIQYQQLEFESEAEEIFDRALYHVLFGDADSLNINKLSRRFNSQMSIKVDDVYKNYEKSHQASFDSWMEALLDTIQQNIEKLSPQLRYQAELIENENEKIRNLEIRMEKLNGYREQIERMMAWKEL